MLKVFNSRSLLWIWRRGRAYLHHEFANPDLGTRFVGFLEKEMSLCSVST